MPTPCTTDPDQAWLAAAIRAARVTAGARQGDIARRARLRRTALVDIEHGRRRVDTFEACRLAAALGTTVDQLVGVEPITPQVLDLVAGLTPDQVADLALFAEFLLWRAERCPA
jgi:transcriptional regulator with XRE-family HTH domain